VSSRGVVDEPEEVFWQCLRGCGAFWRNAVEADRQDAQKAWARISRYGLDADRIATLINAAWRYAQARWLRRAHKEAHRGEEDKAARITIECLAVQCEDLDRAIRNALQDPVARHWLLATIPSPDDDLVNKTLPALLKKAAAAMRSIPPNQSQAAILLDMRRAALNEMVRAVAPSGRNVPWTALAQIVNIMPDASDCPVAAKDLHLEYTRSR